MRIEGTPFIVLQAGTLDDDPEVQMFRHAFVGQKACWYEIFDNLPCFEGQPRQPTENQD